MERNKEEYSSFQIKRARAVETWDMLQVELDQPLLILSRGWFRTSEMGHNIELLYNT